MKAASARSKAGSLAYLKRQEKHAKREDYLAQKRRNDHAEKIGVDPQDLPGPLVHGTLDLEDALEAHLDGAKKNSAAKNVALHMIVRFPPEVLEGEGAGKIVGTEDERKQIMLDLAVKFVNDTHGGNAVFAARMDRDEEGQSIVDVFYAPVYEKRTKRTPPDEKGEMWVSLTKFAKELAQKHEPAIRKRLENSKDASKLTSPRAVGIALQEELALFMKNEVGLDLDDRNAKLYSWSDWKSKEAYEADLLTARLAEAVAGKEKELGQREAASDEREAAMTSREKVVKSKEAAIMVGKLEATVEADELAQARKAVEADKASAAAARAAVERIEKEAEAKALEAAEAAAAAAALREAAQRDRLAAEAALAKAGALADQAERVNEVVQTQLKEASKLVGILDGAMKGLSDLLHSEGLFKSIAPRLKELFTKDVRAAITSLGEMLTYRRPEGEKSDAAVLKEEISMEKRALAIPERRDGTRDLDAYDPFGPDVSPDEAVGGGPGGPGGP